MLGNFSCVLLSADFFQNHPFRIILSGIPSESQTVWIQIRPDILSGLIWVQTVCKGHQQTTPAVNCIPCHQQWQQTASALLQSAVQVSSLTMTHSSLAASPWLPQPHLADPGDCDPSPRSDHFLPRIVSSPLVSCKQERKWVARLM